MRVFDLIRHPSNRLDVVAGLIDGVLNALALAAGHLLKATGDGTTFGLAVRVGLAAGVTTIFVFFVAHYAQLRLELVRHERELNLSAHGRLAATRLGRSVLIEATFKACLAATFSLAGAGFPLALCALLPSPPWLGLGLTIASLGILGALLAKTFYGSPWLWGTALLLGGIALTIVGVHLSIVG